MSTMAKKNITCTPCMQNKGKKLILLGNDGKRKDYFLKAAKDLNKSLLFFPLFSEDIFKIKNKDEYMVKIDPLVYNSSDYSILQPTVREYFSYLNRLEESNFNFLNSPSSIRNSLDKKNMRDILINNSIPMSESIDLVSSTREELFTFLENKGISNVFIKPRYGSGAVGILALKCNFKRNQFTLFTSLLKVNGIYSNTKKLRKIRDKDIIFDLLDRILRDKPIVEKWIEKKRIYDKPFDLRVLVNFDQVDFIVGRSSTGPITNLHLNNNAIDFRDLNLDEGLVEEIEKLSKKAVQSFSGLNYAGVDVLPARNGKIYIIEVNSQGDLIYKDIFNKNLIYKKQIERI